MHFGYLVIGTTGRKKCLSKSDYLVIMMIMDKKSQVLYLLRVSYLMGQKLHVLSQIFPHLVVWESQVDKLFMKFVLKASMRL